MTRFRSVYESERINKTSAFTLAEMMVVMLILSVILAAMAPVMTTRYKSKPNDSSPWKYEANNRLNAYFGGPNSIAMIGQNEFQSTDDRGKLLIKLDNADTDYNFLAFKRGDNKLGRLYINNDGGLMFGSTTGRLGTNANSVGRMSEASGTNATAFGSVAKANKDAATAVGSSVTASGVSSLAVGTSSNATADNSIAIGNAANGSGASSIAIGQSLTASEANAVAVGSGVTVSGSGSIAVGQSAYTSGVNTLVIGNNASIANGVGRIPDREKNKSDGSVVIGANASSVLYDSQTSKNVVVIGAGAKADAPLQRSGDGVIAIGENARAKQEGAIALGRGAEADGYYWNSSHNTGYASAIAIGTSAKSYRPRSIAIGKEATITSSELGDSIAIGTNATAASSYGSDIAIGTKSNTNGNYSIALGASANNPSLYEARYWSNEQGGYSVKVNEKYASGNSSIAIGYRVYAKGAKSIAIGNTDSFQFSNNGGWNEAFTYSGGGSSIAIGSGAQSAGNTGVAIGKGAAAVGDYSIAIGENAHAYGTRSVAIGKDTRNSRADVIQLGNGANTVYIPGRLIVGLNSFFGANVTGDNQAVGGHWGNGGVRDWIRDYNKGFDVANAKPAPGQGYDEVYKFMTTSDRRLKYVGKENKSGLDKIRQLKVFNYTFKKDAKKEPHVGVIAQDLQKVFPNAVKKGADGFLTIRMEDMFYAVINAIKELDAKYQAQEKRINELEKRIEKLEAKAK